MEAVSDSAVKSAPSSRSAASSSSSSRSSGRGLASGPGSAGKGHDPDRIVVQGAREHNLKNVDLDIPRDSLVVFTGLSGSGKSSLAFDTIFAEGQRRYVELSLIHI